MFRRPKPKPPLAQVQVLIDAAVLIVDAYWRDETFQPTAADLELLDGLQNHVFLAHGRIRRLGIRLHRRFHGEPEVNERSWK